jgi:tyrosyl-tRNA synthetase
MTITQCLGVVIHTMVAARAGCGVRIVIADTLALLNGDKLGGDWVRIRVTTRRNVAKLEAALKALDVGVGVGVLYPRQ